MLKRNGYVLEQLLSPLILSTSSDHEELKRLAPQCITRHHFHHYRGFAANQWKLFNGDDPQRVKPLLYVYRVLLTGVHLMRTGEVEANLVNLLLDQPLAHVSELIAQKSTGGERQELAPAETEFHQGEYERLFGELERAYEKSTLPELPTAGPALSDLVIQIRLRYV